MPIQGIDACLCDVPPGSSGLSVEQRKRLTIAVELVANPSIVFMDEPTSGLSVCCALSNPADSAHNLGTALHCCPLCVVSSPRAGLDARAAAIVMRAVRNTVDTGRTVVCTIHQPSIDIFEVCLETLAAIVIVNVSCICMACRFDAALHRGLEVHTLCAATWCRSTSDQCHR